MDSLVFLTILHIWSLWSETSIFRTAYFSCHRSLMFGIRSSCRLCILKIKFLITPLFFQIKYPTVHLYPILTKIFTRLFVKFHNISLVHFSTIISSILNFHIYLFIETYRQIRDLWITNIAFFSFLGENHSLWKFWNKIIYLLFIAGTQIIYEIGNKQLKLSKFW